ncbi:hypothetical protein [Fluviicola sp.]|jgi:hypothetical protein|uniref:hypothetical protein n=1 Tax=Fluviicola sp. TaxID=1917219 RepID=UPI00282D55F7|nr:hypothetical protein [Fluviicola sp.]MDR0803134.1 hypothetical protein [Fluviicola sp.]
MHQRLFVFLLLALIATPANAQIHRHQRKRSTNAGTLFFYWGYNRAAYTKSAIHFTGLDYDFELKGVKATDRQPKFGANLYLNPANMTIPQYNFRIGYYFTEKWAFSLGIDHFNYVMAPNNEVVMDGHFGIGVDSVWTGNYQQESTTINPSHFHYEHSGGLNYLRIELMRSYDLWEAGSHREFAVTGNVGLNLGPMLTTTNFLFANKQTNRATALSGYGIGASASARLEFFKHVFIQGEGELVFTHLLGVHTRPNDRNQRARQVFGLAAYNVSLGLLFYIKTKNGCDSCPHW